MIGLALSDKKLTYVESHNPGWLVEDTTAVREGSGENTIGGLDLPGSGVLQQGGTQVEDSHQLSVVTETTETHGWYTPVAPKRIVNKLVVLQDKSLKLRQALPRESRYCNRMSVSQSQHNGHRRSGIICPFHHFLDEGMVGEDRYTWNMYEITQGTPSTTSTSTTAHHQHIRRETQAHYL